MGVSPLSLIASSLCSVLFFRSSPLNSCCFPRSCPRLFCWSHPPKTSQSSPRPQPPSPSKPPPGLHWAEFFLLTCTPATPIAFWTAPLGYPISFSHLSIKLSSSSLHFSLLIGCSFNAPHPPSQPARDPGMNCQLLPFSLSSPVSIQDNNNYQFNQCITFLTSTQFLFLPL